MAAKDFYYHAVKNALLKDEWVIVEDPLNVKIEEDIFDINLVDNWVLAADKNGQKIAIEITKFLNSSQLQDFHIALGQFVSYRLALEMTEPDRVLYLGVSCDVFDDFFQTLFIKESVKVNQVKLLIYDPVREVIREWIN